MTSQKGAMWSHPALPLISPNKVFKIQKGSKMSFKNENNIARVFPRKTTFSPDDSLSFFSHPYETKQNIEDLNIKEVHVSVTWTYDMEKAEKLAQSWSRVAPVKLGGPALGEKGGEFTPGMYLKKGNVITSRGCPNKCWFCSVHKREGGIRELKINEGYNVVDDNLLACSDEHIITVFRMLKKQKTGAVFGGGLEAKILKEWHVALLWDLIPECLYFAYDTEDDLDSLIEAGKKLRYANFTRRKLKCYVLIGYKNDTLEKAKKRLLQTWEAGFSPMSMLWRNKKGDKTKEWSVFQREWSSGIISSRLIKNSILAQYTRGSAVQFRGNS
jgi:hypothetical protein